MCFRRLGHNILHDRWYADREVDEEMEKLRIVKTAAAIILEDMRSTAYDVTTYPPSDQFFDNVQTLVPTTLKCLLEG